MKYTDPANLSPKTVQKITLKANIITLSGSTTDGHTANITINGVLNYTIATVAGTSLTTTATNWCAANYDYYKVKGYLVTSSGAVITVNPAHGWDTTNRIDATIATVTGTLTGTLKSTLTIDGSTAKVWEVSVTTASLAIAAPVGMKDANTIILALSATGTTAVTSASTVYMDGLGTASFSITSTSPYIANGFYDAVSGRLILTSTSNQVLVATSTGRRLYGMLELTGTSPDARTIKAHAHLNTAEYANEFKGEFLSAAGVGESQTMDGIAAHYIMQTTGGTGTGVMRSVLGVAYLPAATAITGTDAAKSWISGGGFAADIAATATLNGTAVRATGLFAKVSSAIGSNMTSVKHVAAATLVSGLLVKPTAGECSILHLSQEAGATTVNQAIYVEGGATVDSLFTIDVAAAGKAIETNTAVPDGATSYCIHIKIGNVDGYIPVFAAKTF
jgi:hypothetical protein